MVIHFISIRFQPGNQLPGNSAWNIRVSSSAIVIYMYRMNIGFTLVLFYDKVKFGHIFFSILEMYMQKQIAYVFIKHLDHRLTWSSFANSVSGEILYLTFEWEFRAVFCI